MANKGWCVTPRAARKENAYSQRSRPVAHQRRPQKRAVAASAALTMCELAWMLCCHRSVEVARMVAAKSAGTMRRMVNWVLVNWVLVNWGTRACEFPVSVSRRPDSELRLHFFPGSPSNQTIP